MAAARQNLQAEILSLSEFSWQVIIVLFLLLLFFYDLMLLALI